MVRNEQNMQLFCKFFQFSFGFLKFLMVFGAFLVPKLWIKQFDKRGRETKKQGGKDAERQGSFELGLKYDFLTRIF